MRSMTGYGRARAEAPDQNLAFDVEISTVNRKNFDLQVSVPREWTGFEQALNDWLSGEFHRGRAQLTVKPGEQASPESGLHVESTALDRTLSELRAYAESRNLSFEPDARLLFDIARVSGDAAGLPDWRDFEDALRDAVLRAAGQVKAMRDKEGSCLAEDLRQRLAALRDLREQIEKHTEGATREYRDALLERLRQLELELDLGDERVLRELALFADRSDISEELTRLQSHFAQFLGLLDEDGPAGRRLDFLCQEIHREFNTIASKATRIDITQAVIEGKNLLEQVREQVQNLE